MSALMVILALWFGWLIGWTHAHITVAGECKKLGGFYVGKTTFKCTAMEEKK